MRGRKGSALYDRRIWKGDRVPRSKDLAVSSLFITINLVKPIRLNYKLSFVQIYTFVSLYIVTRHVSALDLAV